MEANALEVLYDAAQDKTVTASLGTMAEGAKTGPAVKTIKLLAQSTGEFTRDELKKDVKFAWTDKAKSEIAAAKGGTSSTGDGTENQGGSNQGNNGGSGSITPSGGDNGGGDNGGDNGGGGGDGGADAN